MRRALAALSALAACLAPAWADDLTVGQGGRYDTLSGAVAASRPGDRLLLAPGAYQASDLRIPHSLVVEGADQTAPGGAVTISAPAAVAKGLLVPGRGADLTIRHVTLMGARSPDKNGAGIRFEGANLLAENVRFTANENGILATGDAGGSLTVRRSLFEENGHGDGYSHGIYQSKGARFVIEESRFVGTRIGHHLKSLAPFVAVSGNSFDDAGGRTSYVVDATGGGRLVILDNEVVRRRDADQETLFNYDTSRGGALSSVTINGNRITTQKPGTRFLRNPEDAPLKAERNKLFMADRGSFRDLPTGVAVAGRAQLAPGGKSDPGALINPVRPPGAAPSRGGAGTPAIDPADLSRLTPQQRRAVARIARRQQAATAEKVGTDERAGGGSSPSAAAVLAAPRIALPRGSAAAFRLVPTGPRGTGPVTFGQVFGPGGLRPGEAVEAILGGRRAAAQLDAKTTYPDGSVRFGVVTLDVPQGGGVLDGSLRRAATLRGAAPAKPAAAKAAKAAKAEPVTVRLRGTGPEGPFDRSVTLGADPKAGVWLEGPLATERTERYALTPLLFLRADRRVHADGTVRTRLTVENHETYKPGPRQHRYVLSVARGGETLYASPSVDHYRHASFSVVVGGGADYAVQHDPRAWIETGAFAPLDLSVPVARAAVAGAPDGPVLPGDHGPLIPYMPTTGGRSEVGPMTAWAARWLKSQDPDARAEMLHVAEIGLTVPWHFSEGGQPLTPARRPRFWADPRGSGAGFDAFPEGVWTKAPGGWTVDLAHKPGLAYPAYLATGEAVFARALAHEAAYAITGIWPDLRGAAGTEVFRELQVRSRAWSLRTVANAAWGLPDGDPLKAEFAAILRANLAAMRDLYVTGGAMDAAGQLEGYLDTDDDAYPAWMQDFMVIVLAQEARRGSGDAGALLSWMRPWMTGRVLATNQGSAFASADRIVTGRGGVPFTRWGEAVTATTLQPGQDRDGAHSYFSVLLGALAADAAAGGETAEAYGALTSEGGPALTDPQNRLGAAWQPQFAVRPPR